ncbi:MAG: SagB/ThcOx family dehydrogenase, partial [Candidatus Altiarchaeota archaeon]|nr:SagB/ThcOx family dehydrogenase [Candidatus Altiarchaeota archaeon]
TVPSAGATYPLEIYAAVSNVEGFSPGLYHYLPEKHGVELVYSGDALGDIANSTYQREMVYSAAFAVVISAVYNRTTRAYGEHGVMYVHMEAGHTGQNIYLQSEALGLGVVAVGAMDPMKISHLKFVGEPIYVFPVGVV